MSTHCDSTLFQFCNNAARCSFVLTCLRISTGSVLKIIEVLVERAGPMLVGLFHVLATVGPHGNPCEKHKEIQLVRQRDKQKDC